MLSSGRQLNHFLLMRWVPGNPIWGEFTQPENYGSRST